LLEVKILIEEAKDLIPLQENLPSLAKNITQSITEKSLQSTF
jgi:hypothetical protein